jgi:hypothetical protein
MKLNVVSRTVRPGGALAALAMAAVLSAVPAVTAPRAHAQDSSAAPQSTAAGDTAQNMADMTLVRAAINADRVDILNSYLGLTDTEATAFWPLYKQFRADLNKVSDDQVKLVANYLQSRDTLSDDEAKKITDGLLNSRKKKVDIQKSYLGKFAKIIPGKKVARLYQLENKVDSVVAYEAASRIPLVPLRSSTSSAAP